MYLSIVIIDFTIACMAWPLTDEVRIFLNSNDPEPKMRVLAYRKDKKKSIYSLFIYWRFWIWGIRKYC